jgi:hypothetical protein
MAAWAWLEGHLWLALPPLALPAVWPFLNTGLPKGADSLMHLMRLAALDHQIRQGTLYPRWISELMLGHGYPVFSFYGPLTYYLAEAFHLAGLSYYFAFMAVCILLIVGAGFGMYLLAQDTFGPGRPWPALVAATAYMYAPYLITNVIVRGAIAEAGAQALLPVIFWSTRRLLTSREPGRYVLAVALSLGALAICHNITLLFTPPVLLAYAVVIWWRTGRDLPRLGWLALGLAAAVGASAFFVLPLAVERQYLIDSPYEISKVTLPENAWHGLNFLNQHFIYAYSFAIPFQIGLVQLVLAVGGSILPRRRDAEWLFWIAAVVVAGLGVTAWSLPIWLNSPILLIAQFPWRLLSIMSVPLALLTGGCVAGIGRHRLQVTLALPLLALIIATQAPRLDNWLFFSQNNARITSPVNAHLELDTRAMGASGIQEFRPRWAVDATNLNRDSAQGSAQATIALQNGGPYDLEAGISSRTGGPVRFQTYYFPGWHALLDGNRALSTYPSTNLGLLTVDLPPGQHQLSIGLGGTPLERAAEYLTLLTLAGLTWLAWHQSSRRAWALLPLTALLLGTLSVALPRPLVPIQPPAEPGRSDGLQVLGFHLEQDWSSPGEAYIYLYPYWYISAALPADWQMRWQLQDTSGRTVAETTSRPYFNTSHANNWPVSTLVDDGYQLPVPAGLPAGSYRIAGQALSSAGPSAGEPFLLGNVVLPATTPQPSGPAQPLHIRMGDQIQLAGFNARNEGHPMDFVGTRPPVVRPGQRLTYTLFWQATGPIPLDYHGFVHMVDNAGQTLAQVDQLPGPYFRPPMLWDNYHLQPDDYLVWIPKDAPNGLLWPTVGLFENVRGTRTPKQLAAYDATGQELTIGARLPPVKIIGPGGPPPQHQLGAQFPGLARVIGYDLAPPAEGIRAGSALTLTLHYQVTGATDRDYTRFVHLYGPAGLIAGTDSPPAGGANPTWAWAPGEIVVDRVTLPIDRGVTPGTYRLAIGLYDRDANGERLPVVDSQGHPVTDAEVTIGQIAIRP